MSEKKVDPRWVEMIERCEVIFEEHERRGEEKRKALEELIDSGKPFRIVRGRGK